MPTRRPTPLARRRLAQVARTAYSAAAGHLEVEPRPAETEPTRHRWGPRPRAAAAVVALLVLVAAVGGVKALGSAGSDQASVAPGTGWGSAEESLGSPSDAPGDEEQAGAGSGTADAGTAGEAVAGRAVVVHVAGQVAHPGVVEVPAGSRVHEAVEAAGGAREEADLNALNLARPVDDGERVYVPAVGEPAPAAAPAPGTGGGAAERLDLNTAGPADLEDLPGIGPVLAQRILDWRREHGRFTDVAELGEVSGIGPTVLERLRDRVTV